MQEELVPALYFPSASLKKGKYCTGKKKLQTICTALLYVSTDTPQADNIDAQVNLIWSMASLWC